MCPRTRTGALRCPLDPKLPYPFEKHYVEGSALQWLWFVPHDPLLLVQLFGSNASFVAKLDAFMVDARRWRQCGGHAADSRCLCVVHRIPWIHRRKRV